MHNISTVLLLKLLLQGNLMVPGCTMDLFSVKILLQIIITPQQTIKATLINSVSFCVQLQQLNIDLQVEKACFNRTEIMSNILLLTLTFLRVWQFLIIRANHNHRRIDTSFRCHARCILTTTTSHYFISILTIYTFTPFKFTRNFSCIYIYIYIYTHLTVPEILFTQGFHPFMNILCK